MRYPNIFTVKGLIDCATTTHTQINGKWVPCRPEGFDSFSSRVSLAWKVFTGKADAIIWPEDQ